MAQDFYEMYLEEMGQIAPMSIEEEARILEQTAAGEVQDVYKRQHLGNETSGVPEGDLQTDLQTP